MGIGAGLAAVGTAIGTAASSIGAAGVAGLATTAIGAGVSAYGALSSSSAQQKAANYQAQVAKNNAQVASQNAETATQAGQAAATTQSMRSRAAMGAAEAGMAANGISVDSGSAAQSLESQRELGALDTQTTVHNAALQAYGFQTQSANDLGQASLQKATASDASAAGGLAAGGDLLSGASSVGLNWQKIQQQTGNSGSSTATSATWGDQVQS